jgi:hypothetical protein
MLVDHGRTGIVLIDLVGGTSAEIFTCFFLFFRIVINRYLHVYIAPDSVNDISRPYQAEVKAESIQQDK